MFFIEGIAIRNFKSLNNVVLGRKWNTNGTPLPEVVCCIGPPNSGKSNFLEVFRFIRDINELGTEVACNTRGGYSNVRTKGKYSPIEFEFVLSDVIGSEYRYLLSIMKDEKGNITRKDNITAKISKKAAECKDYSYLIPKFFDDIFIPRFFFDKELRTQKRIFFQNKLMEDGSNFVYVLNRKSGWAEHDKFFARHIRGNFGIKDFFTRVDTTRDEDGEEIYHQVLNVQFEHIKEHYYGDNRHYLTTSMLKYMAYVTMMRCFEDFGFLCVEHMDDGLYFREAEYLTDLLIGAACESAKNVFMITYSPCVLNMMDDKNVFIFHTDEVGLTQVKQASTLPIVHGMMAEGGKMGYLWTSDYLTPDKDGTFPGNPEL